MNRDLILPAEWFLQSAVQLTWPHEDTDWVDILEEACICYKKIASEVLKRQKLVIVTPKVSAVKTLFSKEEIEKIFFICADSDDTWARDHGPIIVFEKEKSLILDFSFNGWGLKYPYKKDNDITSQLYRKGLFDQKVVYKKIDDFVLEGGSIESDGAGTILTTSKCLLSPLRNGNQDKASIEKKLEKYLGTKRVLWLDHGFLMGDDTDGHIDTLARFCDENTIAYVSCKDNTDPHFEDLKKMEEQLQTFMTAKNKPYKLVPLPFAKAITEKGKRLPATYANFLIINSAVLFPLYNIKEDEAALETIKKLFPELKVVGINCRALIKQFGSLHCITMQYPAGVLNPCGAIQE